MDEGDWGRFEAHPFAFIGCLYGKILAKFLGPAQALNVKIEQIRFFNTQSWDYTREKRSYATRFPQQSSRNIICEVSVRKLRWQPTRVYSLTCCYYRPDGSLLNAPGVFLVNPWYEKRFSHPIEPTWTGGWIPGVYTVQVLLDDMEVAKSTFTIEPPVLPPPPPPPPPAEVLQQPSVQFYASETGRFQTESHRYSIRFPQQSTRWVICELTVRNRLYRKHDRTYHLTAQCYTAEGKLLWEDRRNWLITSQEQEPSISWGLQAGQWTVGICRVDILIDGEEFAWGAFVIE